MTFGEVPAGTSWGVSQISDGSPPLRPESCRSGTLSTLFAGGLYRAAQLSYWAGGGCVTLLP